MIFLRKLIEDLNAGAVGFIIGMLVVGLTVAILAGTYAAHIYDARNNSSVDSIAGMDPMLGLVGLLFFVIPVVIFARAAK